MIDTRLGEFGEQELRAQVERALLAAGVRFAGRADKGLDLIVQFESAAPDHQPLHYAVQVKTGDSFAELKRGRWHITGLDQLRFRQWTKSITPVLFVWVRPSNPAECYWALIKRDSEMRHFTIARRALICPTTRFDLTLETARDGELVQMKAELLRPSITMGLRDYAKEYYRRRLLGGTVVSPVLGPVEFTWSAWRHMTRRGRSSQHIAQSLQLLSAVESVIRQAGRFRALRRISHVVRGAWTCDTRLIALRGVELHFASRAPAVATLVCREQVWFPTHWHNHVQLHRDTRRVVAFHSIYEKVESPRP